MRRDTTSAEFFEAKYQAARDPWNFSSSAYEGGRYDATMRMLEGRAYQRALEPGCSIGVLTERLAAICDRVEAIEISPTAVAEARERCRDLQDVHIECAALPEGSFDLILLSEIGYYFAAEALATLCEQLIGRLRASGTLLAAHWLGTSEDHVLTGDRVHEILGGVRGLVLERSERHTGFRLDRWGRA